MNKIILTSLLVFLTVAASAQKVIERPSFKGTTANYIKILKVEMTDTATVIDFRVHFTPNMWIRVPKETWIQDSNGGEKLYVKSAKGIEIGTEHFTPENGVNEYTLYFPPVGDEAEAIDYLEHQWKIFGIDLGRSEKFSIFPEPLLGNWLRTDGSNEWVYGFYEDMVVYDGHIWKQVLISQKDGLYEVVLQKEGKRKRLIVKQQDDLLLIGTDKDNLEFFSRETTEKPGYVFANDEEFRLPIFKKDTAFYCGYIKGYHPDMGKTGMIYVNNILSQNQESYLIDINPDGSFLAKFPMLYPQPVFVRILNSSENIFCEPGKTTFHFKDLSKYHDDEGPTFLFMGSTAQINQDLMAMNFIRFLDFRDMQNKILDMTPEEYKAYVLDIKKREIEAVEAYAQENAVSKKALQIKKMQINFSSSQNILSYNMDRQSVYRMKYNVPNEQREIPLERVNFTKEFYDFIYPDELNSPLSVIAGGDYYFLINRVRFADGMRPKTMSIKANAEDYFKEFEARNIHLTSTEKELVEKIGSDSDSVRMNIFKVDSVFAKNFMDTHSEVFSTVSSRLYSKMAREFQVKALEEFFSLTGGFATDIMLAQEKSGRMKSSYEPFTEEQKEEFKNEIQNEFIISYLLEENAKLEREIAKKQEAFRNASGFVVNETPKVTEGDLFDTIMKKYRGKVVFVDFWATWCGPCRSGMEQIKPLKEELKDKELVFVYITNPSSPQKTWELFIPDIHGEHYYLTQDEWNTMAARFNVGGIPHYVLVGKDGTVLKDKVYFASSNTELKKMFEENLELKK
jgi:thiol-disulfide isomerase/thioredoxin